LSLGVVTAALLVGAGLLFLAVQLVLTPGRMLERTDRVVDAQAEADPEYPQYG